MGKNRLCWPGHVMRRGKTEAVIVAMELNVETISKEGKAYQERNG